MRPILTLNKSELKITEFCSTDDNRPMLTHILVHKVDGKVRLDATDSYTGILYSPGMVEQPEDFQPFLIPSRTLRMLHKLAGKRKVSGTRRPGRANLRASTVIDEVHIFDKYATIPTLGVKVDYETEENPERFPDLDKVLSNVQRSKLNEPVNVNHKLLSKATGFIASVDSTSGEVEIELTGKLNPVEVRGSRSKARAVVMPLRA